MANYLSRKNEASKNKVNIQRRLAIEESDRPEEMVHPVSRPLILENNGCADVREETK